MEIIKPTDSTDWLFGDEVPDHEAAIPSRKKKTRAQIEQPQKIGWGHRQIIRYKSLVDAQKLLLKRRRHKRKFSIGRNRCARLRRYLGYPMYACVSHIGDAMSKGEHRSKTECVLKRRGPFNGFAGETNTDFEFLVFKSCWSGLDGLKN
jgi:hypothetical protein